MNPELAIEAMIIPVRDLAKSINWYSNVLGFRLIRVIDRQAYMNLPLGNLSILLLETAGGLRKEQSIDAIPRTGLLMVAGDAGRVNQILETTRHSSVRVPSGEWACTIIQDNEGNWLGLRSV